jgi:hypothetical protein
VQAYKYRTLEPVSNRGTLGERDEGVTLTGHGDLIALREQVMLQAHGRIESKMLFVDLPGSPTSIITSMAWINHNPAEITRPHSGGRYEED